MEYIDLKVGEKITKYFEKRMICKSIYTQIMDYLCTDTFTDMIGVSKCIINCFDTIDKKRAGNVIGDVEDKLYEKIKILLFVDFIYKIADIILLNSIADGNNFKVFSRKKFFTTIIERIKYFEDHMIKVDLSFNYKKIDVIYAYLERFPQEDHQVTL